MRVAFVSSYAGWVPHFETELELMQKHLDAGDEVVWVRCDGVLDACEPNPYHTRKNCRRCRSRADVGRRQLRGDVVELQLSSLVDTEVERELDELPKRHGSVENLKAFTVDGLDAGWGALSSTIWIHCEAEVDPDSDMIARFLRAAVRNYRATQRLLREHTVDRVYVFNGRMAPMRGILRATREAGIDCFVHERGRDIHHYTLFENCMPHDIAPTIARIHRAWSESELSVEERERIGASWFDARVEGNGGSWFSFVEGQEAGALPDGWDPERRNVVCYTSSEYEYAAIGKEWAGTLFETPYESVIGIAEELSRRGSCHLTIRIHPNRTAAKSRSVARLRELDLPHVTVVPPEAKVSTYGLMAAADVVVSSGSTTGIEAVYHGVPSVLVSAGLCYGLGAAHEPATREELFRMLEDPDLEPGSKDLALRYGYYQATLGEPFEHFEATGLFSGKFSGVAVRPTRLSRRLSDIDEFLDKVRPRVAVDGGVKTS